MSDVPYEFRAGKNLPPRRWQGKLQTRGRYFPKKKSANVCPFGVPTPVTLSQPLFVCRPRSVSYERTNAVSCKLKASHRALTNGSGGLATNCAAVYLIVPFES